MRFLTNLNKCLTSVNICVKMYIVKRRKDMEKLTKRQEDALKFIKTYIVSHGCKGKAVKKRRRKRRE